MKISKSMRMSPVALDHLAQIKKQRIFGLRSEADILDYALQMAINATPEQQQQILAIMANRTTLQPAQ